MITFFKLQSLSAKICSLVVALFLFVFAGVYQNMVNYPIKHYLEQAKNQRQIILYQQAQIIEKFLSPVQSNVEILRGRFEQAGSISHRQKQWLPTTTDSSMLWFVSDMEGTVFASNNSWEQTYNGTFDIERTPFKSILPTVEVANLSGRGGIWSGVFLDAYLGEYVIGYGSPIISNNSLIGMVGGIVRIDNLILSQLSMSFGQGIKVFAHTDSGEVVYHPDYGLKLLRDSESQTAAFGSKSLIRDSLSAFIHLNKEGQPPSEITEFGEVTFTDSLKLNSINWYLVVLQPKSEILKDVKSTKVIFVGGSIVILFLLALITYFFTRLVITRRAHKVMGQLDRWQHNAATDDELDSNKDELSFLSLAVARYIEVENKQKSKIIEHNKSLESQIETSQAFSQAISFSDSVVVLLDLNLIIVKVDSKVEQLFRKPQSEMNQCHFLEFIHPHMAFIKEQIANQLRRKNAWQGELVIQRGRSQEEGWVKCNITPMRNPNGDIKKYVVTLQDISSVKNDQSQIERLAYTDELTGLSNRSFFVAQLEKLVEISKRGRYDFALFYFDIDDFKKINDFMGHEGGDELLATFSHKVAKTLRSEDVFARMGGDEFALITSGITSQENVIVKINKILAIAREPFEIQGHTVQVGVSIGVTMSSLDDSDSETMLQHADMAMYEAKAQGKNTYHFFSQELNDVAKARIEIEQDLLLAVETDELELYFQPKVDSRVPSLIGFEALLRWTSPKRGFVSPAEFIPLAEQSNLILRVGNWVIKSAFDFVAQSKHNVPVSINLSAKQFESGSLYEDLKRELDRTGVSAALIEVEITESSLMKDVESAIHQLVNIQSLGVSISIDDFGTGYSSLSYLKRLPVTTLKIDRSFIKDIPDDRNDMEITSAIIAMAKQLGLNVIAEGAETREQIEFLAENNCYFIQGFYFCKPLPKKEALLWAPSIVSD